MTSTWPRAAVFDLDGTLVDSAPDIALALNTALKPHGAMPFASVDVIKLIGGGAMAAIDKALIVASLEANPAMRAEILQAFMAAYIDVSAAGRGLFPGAQEMLGGLNASGVACGICTNKAEDVAAVALKALGIDHHFKSIVGASSRLAKKPDAAMLLHNMLELGVTPRDTVMIGDSPADYGVARAAGVPVILVDFGYTHTPVSELGADAIVSHLSEIPAALAAIGSR
jgi:phosphoglycolate phosphatase